MWGENYTISGGSEGSHDAGGVGLSANRDLDPFDVVFQDVPVLRAAETNPELCEAWFWEELSSEDQQRVLRLKHRPNDDLLSKRLFAATVVGSESARALAEVLQKSGGAKSPKEALESHIDADAEQERELFESYLERLRRMPGADFAEEMGARTEV